MARESFMEFNFSTSLSRHIASIASALVYSAIYYYLFTKEYTRLEPGQLYMLLSIFWAGNLVFSIIMVAKINQFFQDTSLSMLQLLWSTAFAILAVYYLNHLREIILMFYFAMLSFGFFRFRTYQFIICGVIAIIGYLGVILLLSIQEPLRINTTHEMLRFISFTLTTIIIVYSGSSVSKLRAELRQKNIDLNESVELNIKLATTDDLTGLHTRRYFLDVVAKQKARSDRDDSDFVVCFADLDHFKYVNDSYGHHTGDIVLQVFANIIKESIREIDYAARFGGEEFLMLLVNSDIDQAYQVAERVRVALDTYNFSDVAPALHVTTSIGVANYKAYNSVQETLMSADNRMYKAKEKGRNQIISS